MGAAYYMFLITLSLTVAASVPICGGMAPPPLSTYHDSSSVSGIPVTIINLLPRGDSGEALDVDCNDSYSAEVGSGGEYTFFFRSDETEMGPVMQCDASWVDRTATFEENVGHGAHAAVAVYWLVNVHGVYLSWDKKSWRRKAAWRSSE